MKYTRDTVTGKKFGYNTTVRYGGYWVPARDTQHEGTQLAPDRVPRELLRRLNPFRIIPDPPESLFFIDLPAIGFRFTHAEGGLYEVYRIWPDMEYAIRYRSVAQPDVEHPRPGATGCCTVDHWPYVCGARTWEEASGDTREATDRIEQIPTQQEQNQ